MSDLTTTADVKAYLGLSTTGQDTLIAALITRESAMIEQWCGRTFSVTTRTGQRVNGTGTNMLVLPDDPILTVTSVKDGNTIIPASSDGVAYGYIYDDRLVYLVGGKFTYGRQNIVVDYTAGYNAIPAPVAQACIEMVGIDLRNRDNLGLNSKTLGNETVSYSSKGMNQSVIEQLTPYRRRYIG